MITASPLALLTAYRYWILFPLAFIEGPVISLIAGLFVAQGTLSPLPTYAILCLGDIIPDMLYFGIGRLSHSVRFLSYFVRRFGFSGERLIAVEHLWQRHTFKSVLIAKWAYGLSTPLLMTAGLARLSTKKFILHIIPIVLTQYAILLVVGYYFGSSYQVINTYIQDAGWFIAIAVVIFIILYFYASRYAKRLFFRNIQ